MSQRVVYENLEAGIHVSLAAKAALQYFDKHRAQRQYSDPADSVEYVFVFNDTPVCEAYGDTVDTLATRWYVTHEENYLKRELRRKVLEASPELDNLIPTLSLVTAVGLGNTLDWIAKFATLADDSVVEAYGKEVLDELQNRGFTAETPLPGGDSARREAVLKSKEAYGRHIVGLFMFELAKGRAVERKFDDAVKHYDSMCPPLALIS